MIKHLFYSTLFFVGLAVCAYAKPMDAKAAEKIPELRQIAMNIRGGESLSQEERGVIGQCIDSKDPVLLSISAWIIGEENGGDEGLSEKLKVVGQGKLDDMSLAFIRIALEKRDAKRQGHQWVPSKELQDDPNPYLRIETTRALLRSRPDEGMAALRKIQADEQPLIKAAAANLSAVGTSTPTTNCRVPMIDERYELLLSVIQED
ncbi:MAG: HEAT repeat domain-containing protein [Kiritimatiellia bacterium]|jgi:hypothetical protein|nr:HEAT repeat domain-containing protein [Lentisphaerota bacterium]